MPAAPEAAGPAVRAPARRRNPVGHPGTLPRVFPPMASGGASRSADRSGRVRAPHVKVAGPLRTEWGMTTFGRYLLDHGILRRAQLEDVTQVMVVFGGRLGSILVEAGLLTLEEVEEHLSRHLGLPRAPAERLERPDPDALRV